MDMHWKKSVKCANALDKDSFNNAYNKYKKEGLRLRHIMKCKKYIDKQRAQNEEMVKEKLKKRQTVFT